MAVPRIAISDEDISRCFPVIAELRPQLQADSFVNLVRGMEAEGFRLAFIEDRQKVVAAAGFRIFTSLFMGKNLYVDDLVTTEESRSAGHGKVMLDWLRDVAREAGCAWLHLDSGTQRHRAHRFYFAQGMQISSFHFSQKLNHD
ncbi:MAG TPA: GNAT family N-acetyltransferase [Woeseiaceae bacterium]|nr:GNAT family N-acetyltransferase [Woeseiaceae bacterium]